LHNLHFDPTTEVKNVCTLFTSMAEKNGNTLKYVVENEQHTMLFGDAQRFQQILYNLLSNAVKFTEMAWWRCLSSCIPRKTRRSN
jgi:signal transduction histidine kinase